MPETETQKKFGPSIALAFTLNYIIGSGFLTIPWAIQRVGVVMGFIFLAVVTLFAVMASRFLLECMARADYLKIHPIGSEIQEEVKYHTIEAHRNNIMNPMSSEASNHDNEEGPDVSADVLLLVGDKKFEITELCEIFLGVNAQRLYTWFVGMFLYGCLWAYSNVFANSFTSVLRLGPHSYYVYMLIFSLIVVPPSLMELNEQVPLQVSLSICRVLMLVVMVGTVAVAMSSHKQAFADHVPEAKHSNDDVLLVHPEYMYLFLPVAAYANIFHHSIPSLSEPVADKSQLGNIFLVALLIGFFGYSAVGIIISLYFGDDVKTASNLNWRSYIGSSAHNPEDGSFTSVVVEFISFFVVLFPALDVASAFPLNAITLGNNMMSTYYGGERIHDMEGSRLLRCVFRLLAAVPPIIAALFVKDLGKITDYTGLFGFAIAFIFPPWLAMASHHCLVQRGMDPRTSYGGVLTGRGAQCVVITAGVAMMCYVFASLVLW